MSLVQGPPTQTNYIKIPPMIIHSVQHAPKDMAGIPYIINILCMLETLLPFLDPWMSCVFLPLQI